MEVGEGGDLGLGLVTVSQEQKLDKGIATILLPKMKECNAQDQI